MLCEISITLRVHLLNGSKIHVRAKRLILRSDIGLAPRKYNNSDISQKSHSYWYRIPDTPVILEVFDMAEDLRSEEVIDMLVDAQYEIAQLLRTHGPRERVPDKGWEYVSSHLLVYVDEDPASRETGPYVTYGLLQIVVEGLLSFFPDVRGGKYDSIRFRVFENKGRGAKKVAEGLLGPYREDPATS